MDLTGFSFVSEKEVGGKLYQAYRNDIDPQECIVICGDESVTTRELATVWNNAGALKRLF